MPCGNEIRIIIVLKMAERSSDDRLGTQTKELNLEVCDLNLEVNFHIQFPILKVWGLLRLELEDLLLISSFARNQ